MKEFLPSFNVTGSSLNEGQLVPSLKQADSHNTYLLMENMLSYNKTFGKHSLGAMVGSTVEQNSSHDIGGFNAAISGNQEYQQYLSAGNPSDLARLTYSFDDRFLLTGSVREDASSRFGPANRSGVFPAVSPGWKIKNEKFLKEVDWLSMAKIRLGWRCPVQRYRLPYPAPGRKLAKQ